MSLRCTIGFIKKKILKTISHSDDGAYGQKDAMNPSGQGYTQSDIFLLLFKKEKSDSESISE